MAHLFFLLLPLYSKQNIMKIVTYQCDLCKEQKDKNELMMFYWKSDIIPQQYILQDMTSHSECDKHICSKCINIIKNS